MLIWNYGGDACFDGENEHEVRADRLPGHGHGPDPGYWDRYYLLSLVC